MCVVCVYMNMLNMVTKIAGHCRTIEKKEENEGHWKTSTL